MAPKQASKYQVLSIFTQHLFQAIRLLNYIRGDPGSNSGKDNDRPHWDFSHFTLAIAVMAAPFHNICISLFSMTQRHDAIYVELLTATSNEL
jgi:hypothetical protein